MDTWPEDYPALDLMEILALTGRLDSEEEPGDPDWGAPPEEAFW